MKTILVEVGEEDLKGNAFDREDCPVYRAMKRVEPRTFVVGITWARLDTGRYLTTIELPERVSAAITALITTPVADRKPFSFTMEVPN